MSTKRILHFAVGSTETFVSQTHTTRDHWNGAFLLSWLSAEAIAETVRHDGDIDYPNIGAGEEMNRLLRAVTTGECVGENTPWLPSRFRAAVPHDFPVAKIVEHVNSRWHALAEETWKLIQPVAETGGECSRAIWERQISSCLSPRWVIENADQIDSDWLDLRERWQLQGPSIPEGGDHCTVMGQWQELSGYTHHRQRGQQNAFWRAIQEHAHRGDRFNSAVIRDGERLCGVSMIRRLLPMLSAEQMFNVFGFAPTESWLGDGRCPSTVYLSALPWFEHINANRDRRSAFKEYVNCVASATEGSVSIDVERPLPLGFDQEASLQHGQVYNVKAITEFGAIPLSSRRDRGGRTGEVTVQKRDAIVEALLQCNEKVGGNAPSHFAYVMFNGDRIGGMIRQSNDGGKAMSLKLRRFSEELFPSIVTGAGGFPMHVHGADATALLPIDRAVECAIAVREAYREVVQGNELSAADPAADLAATMSASVVLAHFAVSLSDVIAVAEQYLKDVAKEHHGRDSLAIALLSRSGVTSDWVGKFKLNDEEDQPKRLLDLQTLIGERRFSEKFFFRMHERYPRSHGTLAATGGVDPEAILLAEYCKCHPAKTKEERERAVSSCRILAQACATPDAAQLQLGGATIARFIVKAAMSFVGDTAHDS